MPRNADVLAICEVAERALLSRDGLPPPPMSRDIEGNTETVSRDGAMECAERRAGDAARQRKRRAEVRANTNGGGSPKEAVP
jgi:hypothetical protein